MSQLGFPLVNVNNIGETPVPFKIALVAVIELIKVAAPVERVIVKGVFNKAPASE